MPPVERPLRVGIVGAGWVATNRHGPAYRSHANAQVVAVHDRRIGHARRLASQTRASVVTDSWEEFLEADLDLVSICTPPFEHEAQTLSLLNRGRNVFVEKPMAMSLDGARAMARAAEANGRLLCISHNFLFSRSMRRVRKVIASGEAGSIRFVMGMQASSPKRRLPNWYPGLPGGLFFDESPHLLYLLAALLRDPKLILATSETADPESEQPVRSLHAVFRSSIAPATLTMCFDAPVSEWHLVVICERRILAVDLFRDISVVLRPDNGHGALDILRTSASAGIQHLAGVAGSGVRHVRGRQNWGHEALIHSVVDAVRNGEPTPVPVEDSLRVAELTDAILGAIR